MRLAAHDDEVLRATRADAQDSLPEGEADAVSFANALTWAITRRTAELAEPCPRVTSRVSA